MMNGQVSGAARIQVLLATHNGERYLAQQLDSLVQQTYPDFEVLLRDDASTDGTVSLLQRYVTAYPKIFTLLTSDERAGSAKQNFLLLMQAADSPFAALCDQDDTWEPDKLARSMQAMQRLEQSCAPGTPLLVFTDLEITDQHGDMLYPSLWARQNIRPDRIQLRHLLLQNVVTGCTALMNRPLLDLSATMPPEAVMHDWWMALLASCFGRLEGLADRTVHYRQHGSNAVGAVLQKEANLVPRWRDHGPRQADWIACVTQARGLLATFGDRLSPEQRSILAALLKCDTSRSRWVRVATFLANGFSRQGLRESLAMLWYLWDMDAAKRYKAKEGV